MPELPEVERGRRIAEAACLHRVIESVFAADDRIVYTGVAPRTFASKLRGRRVEAVRRKGKQLWFTLDQPPHPLFHFGMTGSFRVYQDPSDRPRFCKVELRMDDGTRLAMPNARRLGRIRLQDDPETTPPISKLGFDPYTELPTPAAFRELVGARKAVIKALLLDQSLFAGVGNWIADEVLYQARIDPRRRAHELDRAELDALRKALKRVIDKACQVDADKGRFPRSWLFHQRWGRPQDALTTDGHEIDIVTVAGRSTAWVPAVQR